MSVTTTMSTAAQSTTTEGSRVWLTEDDCNLDEFAALVEQRTDPREYPHAHSVQDNILIYHCDHLRDLARTPEGRREVQAEIFRALLHGPGVATFKGAFPDLGVVDRASEAFGAMIADQHAQGMATGDHYAKPGANDRVWNAIEKLAVRDPAAFAEYYANDIVALVSAAWLGPNYQVTSQVNVVNPGGAAQMPHRDYHLGFLTNELVEQFPAPVHHLSALLTLQGAVAHSDMPVESGPTMYLPGSQRYEPGFLAWGRPEFVEYFQGHRAQLPLDKGDAVFFSPALFHAAGHNRTADVHRMANLLQISSAFGRAMESVDREKMANALYPALVRFKESGASPEALHNAVAACADGYPFPTNLDRDKPIGGLAPESQAEILWRCLNDGTAPDGLRLQLRAYAERRQTDNI